MFAIPVLMCYCYPMSSKLQTHECLICLKTFHSYNIEQKTCSKSCMGKLRHIESIRHSTCKTCGKSFEIRLGNLNEGRGLYCSRECSHKRTKKYDTKLVMELWNKGYSAHRISKHLGLQYDDVIRNYIKSLGLFKKRHASGEQVHAWKGGLKVYRKKALLLRGNKCYICGYDKHPSLLEVHHIDRNRNNASIDNLIPLCPTCHAEKHLKRK